MKKVILVGDSIRFGAEGSPGYGKYVKESIKGRADVYLIDENCRFAQYTLRYFHEWLKKSGFDRVDVIHWNNGLWDLLHVAGDERVFTPLDVYLDTVERIYLQMRRLCPEAKIIFATNTYVIEDEHPENLVRYNKEIEEYNVAVINKLTSLGVEINDLGAITKDIDPSMHSDWVHYTEEGSKILASAVTEKIERYI